MVMVNQMINRLYSPPPPYFSIPDQYANQYVEEQSTEVILNHLMFDRLAACKQSKKRTCLDLFLYHDVKISRRYQVKPENSHFSFEVNYELKASS